MKKKPKTKRTPQNAELINKIKAVILDGDGIRRRIDTNLRMPVKYSRHDGVYYNPEWQDDGAFHGLPETDPERGKKILARIQATLVRQSRHT